MLGYSIGRGTEPNQTSHPTPFQNGVWQSANPPWKEIRATDLWKEIIIIVTKGKDSVGSVWTKGRGGWSSDSRI